MSEHVETERHGRTEEERAYYSFQRRAWAIFAPFYDPLVFVPFRTLRSEVARIVQIPRGCRLLDVATGTGAQAFAFADRAREVVGIDMSAAMLRIARRKNRFPNVTFQQADAAELPFDDESFDASCVSFALHEMPAGVRERVVREMVRVTSPRGRVIVVDYALPRGPLSSWLAYHVIKLYEGDHYATFVKSDLVALLETGGIEVAERQPLLGGIAQVVVGQRSEAVSRVHNGPATEIPSAQPRTARTTEARASHGAASREGLSR